MIIVKNKIYAFLGQDRFSKSYHCPRRVMKRIRIGPRRIKALIKGYKYGKHPINLFSIILDPALNQCNWSDFVFFIISFLTSFAIYGCCHPCLFISILVNYDKSFLIFFASIIRLVVWNEPNLVCSSSLLTLLRSSIASIACFSTWNWKRLIGGIPYTAHGAQIIPPVFLIFISFLFL